MASATRMTVEEFAQMRTGELEDYELVEGELIPLARGTLLHCLVRGRLDRALGNFFEVNPVGAALTELDCRVSEHTVRRPDVAVFLGPRADNLDLDVVPAPHAPDIAVEVLSRSDSAVSVNRKNLDYLAGGSQEVWVLDQANCAAFVRTSTTIRFVRGNQSLDSPLLPGFSVAVSELLAARF